MNKLKYIVLLIGTIISLTTIVLIIINVLYKPMSALIFCLGIILMVIGILLPTQLCEGVP